MRIRSSAHRTSSSSPSIPAQARPTWKSSSPIPSRKKLNELDNIKRIRSDIDDGLLVVQVEFIYSENPDEKYNEVVREGQQPAVSLPADLLNLEIRKVTASDVSTYQLAFVTDSVSYRALYDQAEALKKEIEKIRDVKKVKLHGYPTSSSASPSTWPRWRNNASRSTASSAPSRAKRRTFQRQHRRGREEVQHQDQRRLRLDRGSAQHRRERQRRTHRVSARHRHRRHGVQRRNLHHPLQRQKAIFLTVSERIAPTFSRYRRK